MRPALALALLLAIPAWAQEEAAPVEMGSPAHQAVIGLLGALLTGPFGATPLPVAGACDNDASRAARLSDDVLFYLAALNRDARIAGSCTDGTCQVQLGQAIPDTENVWTRGYRFRRRADGGPDPASLLCFTIP
ncbi:MAG TPA: hypothetical protein VGM87_00715 [Roseomonas sp.]|jgi:hypothetical protein